MAAAALTILHLAPHPDDEVIGAPATLLGLRAAGHRVVNLACSLGRPDDAPRRKAEIEEACHRADFELIIHDPPAAISENDDLQAAQRTLAHSAGELIESLAADLVVAPSPHDWHHGHETVGRAARDAVAAHPRTRLWLWGLWADLPLPTLFSPFDGARLDSVLHALEAHAGEVARNNYPALVEGRARAASVLGAERVFGFGQPGRDASYAELLTEVAFAGAEWWAGAPRVPDVDDPLTAVPQDRPLGWWMSGPSFRERLASAQQGVTARPTSGD